MSRDKAALLSLFTDTPDARDLIEGMSKFHLDEYLDFLETSGQDMLLRAIQLHLLLTRDPPTANPPNVMSFDSAFVFKWPDATIFVQSPDEETTEPTYSLVVYAPGTITHKYVSEGETSPINLLKELRRYL